jgi:hypothetical protein
VGFWPCNPNVPDLPGVRQRAAAIWTGTGDNIYTFKQVIFLKSYHEFIGFNKLNKT